VGGCERVWGKYNNIIGFELVRFAFETFRAKSITINESPIRTFNILNVDKGCLTSLGGQRFEDLNFGLLTVRTYFAVLVSCII
jgi:hypothetical protein